MRPLWSITNVPCLRSSSWSSVARVDAILLGHLVGPVGEDREVKAAVLFEAGGRRFRRIGTERDDVHAGFGEFRQVFLEREELGDAVAAVIPVVEDDEHGALAPQIV